MSRVIGVIVVAGMLFLGIGITIPFVLKQRTVSDKITSRDHLRRIAFASQQATLTDAKLPAHEVYLFPAGTVVRDFPVTERLSWFCLLLGTIGQDPDVPNPKKKVTYPDLLNQLRMDKRWNDPENLVVAAYRIPYFLTPANIPPTPGTGQPYPTQYVGIAGLGLDTASLNRVDAGKRAGIFSYDSATPVSAILDGTSATIAVAETNDSLGPWLQGGPATVRSLDEKAEPYIGVGRPFGGNQLGGANFLMADGSVRTIAERVSPALFRSMLTIAGQEVIYDSE